MLTPTERHRLARERDTLLAQFRRLGNLMRGTIVRVGVQCGRLGCACAQGAKHGKVHLSVTLEGRARTCYLGAEGAGRVAPLLAEYQRAWQLINALTVVNLALLRGQHPGGPSRRRRAAR